MAENNSNKTTASKFSSLLAGAKVEPKKPIGDFLENQPENDKEKKDSIDGGNNAKAIQQQNELKIAEPKQKEIGLVEKDFENKAINSALKGLGEIKTGDDQEQAIGEGESGMAVVAKAETPRKKEGKKNDYERFIKRTKSKKTKPIFITEEFDTLIGKIVSQIGEPGLTKGAYLENILVWHFETFSEEIKQRRREALQKQNNELY